MSITVLFGLGDFAAIGLIFYGITGRGGGLDWAAYRRYQRTHAEDDHEQGW